MPKPTNDPEPELAELLATLSADDFEIGPDGVVVLRRPELAAKLAAASTSSPERGLNIACDERCGGSLQDKLTRGVLPADRWR